MSNYVATEQFYVAIELVRVGRIYVATELPTTESSAAHDRAGSVKAGAHDSVALCCVAIEAHQAKRARQRCTRDR